nr:hypothetical protein [uncultured Arsenicibacter sp.]
MKRTTAAGVIKNGKLEVVDLDGFMDEIRSWDDCEVEITIDYYSGPHSDEVRRYYHACVLPNIRSAIIEQQGFPFSKKQVHLFLKVNFLYVEYVADGEIKQEPDTTSGISQRRYWHYVNQCIDFGVSRLGIPYEKFDIALFKQLKEELKNGSN